ncbi:PepSY domain-containing protein [Curvibacter sp. APW13]|uniref:PepSY domain-containing protein n=1 Tax=Curvibacter sp. APW13 TaxID=3077236 RepID=UPI0028DEDB5B|nr:PepSY domain-containing protein [Curvibacter sp. APW13]MDT8990495.1 PepSY domain-containing protein [Curvibacter sp. APW13]
MRKLVWVVVIGVVWPMAVGAQPAKDAPKLLPNVSREKAADVCTQAPRSEWIDEAEMRLLAEHRGYRIKTFKVANGNCYEVYGFDRDNQIVEAYFDPVTTRLVRRNVAK